MVRNNILVLIVQQFDALSDKLVTGTYLKVQNQVLNRRPSRSGYPKGQDTFDRIRETRFISQLSRRASLGQRSVRKLDHVAKLGVKQRRTTSNSLSMNLIIHLR
jgi:hypothetical protein